MINLAVSQKSHPKTPKSKPPSSDFVYEGAPVSLLFEMESRALGRGLNFKMQKSENYIIPRQRCNIEDIEKIRFLTVDAELPWGVADDKRFPCLRSWGVMGRRVLVFEGEEKYTSVITGRTDAVAGE